MMHITVMTRLRRCVVLLLLLLSSAGRCYSLQNVTEVESDYQRLVSELKAVNLHRTRPVVQANATTTLQFALSPRWVTLDDMKQEMTVDAWSFMSWHDEYLVWDPSMYGGVAEVHLEQPDLWMPDMAIYNRVGGDIAPSFGTAPVLVKDTGSVMWFPPSHLKVPCALDLTMWPKDQHNCTVSLGSWAHYAHQIDLALLSPTDGVILGELHNTASWKVVGVTAARNEQVIGLERHVDLEFAFVVQRQASERSAYIDATMLVAAMAVVFSYFVPVPQLMPRLLLHLFALTVLVMCYLTLYNTLPSYGGPVPLVVKSYSSAMSLSLLSLLTTLWLHRLSTPSGSSIFSAFSRLCKCRKGVGRYNTLVEEQPYLSEVSPTAQMPSTASSTTANHVTIDVPPVAETSLSEVEAPNREENGDQPATENAHHNSAMNINNGSNSAMTISDDYSSAMTVNSSAMTIRARLKEAQNGSRVRVANFFTGLFFSVALLVDYIALKVTLGA